MITISLSKLKGIEFKQFIDFKITLSIKKNNVIFIDCDEFPDLSFKGKSYKDLIKKLYKRIKFVAKFYRTIQKEQISIKGIEMIEFLNIFENFK